MSRLAPAVASAAIALAAPSAVSSASEPGDFWRDCGTRNPSIYVTVWSHAVPCKQAWPVARRYALKGDRHPFGFGCTEPKHKPGTEETIKGHCKREGGKIKVFWGP